MTNRKTIILITIIIVSLLSLVYFQYKSPPIYKEVIILDGPQGLEFAKRAHGALPHEEFRLLIRFVKENHDKEIFQNDVLVGYAIETQHRIEKGQ